MNDAWYGRPPGDAAKRDGWHWMQMGRDPEPAEWSAERQLWRIAGSVLGYASSSVVVAAWRYLGPCLTPAEHAAAVAAAEARGMERAAEIVDAAAKDWFGAPSWISAAIRAATKEPAP